jgi:hypothetical protein
MHPVGVGEIYPMPRLGDVFDDVRDNGRTMRISCHTDRDAVVVSLWHDTLCRGSFRLAADDLDRLISTLTEMSTSLSPALAVAQLAVAPPAGGAVPDERDPESGVAAAGSVPDQGASPLKPAGDDTGTVNFRPQRALPVPRVA